MTLKVAEQQSNLYTIPTLHNDLTSALKHPPAEERLDSLGSEEPPKKVSMRDLQHRVKKDGISPLTFLPFLGRDGYILKGWTHILAAFPKTGKTDLIVDVLMGWDEESILYLTEEPIVAWEARAFALPEGALDNMELVMAMGMDIMEVLKEVTETTATVIVIDSIRDVLHPIDENDNAVVAGVLRPFITVCRRQKKTLIFLHHTSKMGGEHGKAIAGAHAFLGTVDVALELDYGTSANQRKLSGRGRIVVFEDLVYERRDDGRMVALGSPNEVSFEHVQASLFQEMCEEWRPTAELQKLGIASRDTVSRALKSLAERGLIERLPPISEGAIKGATYRWRSHSPSAE